MATDCCVDVGWAKSGQKLYSWGANSYGQLSQGHTEDQMLPRETTLSDTDITYMSGGGGHTLVIDSDGHLYTCGSNNKGQLGFGTEQNKASLTKVLLPEQQRAVKVVGGWDFTLVLADSGDVFVMGSNAFGQLGMSEQKHVNLPTRMVFTEKIIDIAAGLRHAAVLTDSGCVYCWGAGKKGQCGVLIDNKCPGKLTSPSKVTLPQCGGLVGVVAGSHHTAAWTDKGEVLSWGCNKYGQCLQDPGITSQVNTPNSVYRFTDPVKALYSGWTHLLALTDTGDVYSWGRADYGQLGRSCDSKTCDCVPNIVTGLSRVKQLACGSEHNLALNDHGQLLAWGWNEHGICGSGDEENKPTPKQVAALSTLRIKLIGCGNGHSLAQQEVT